MGPEGQRGLCHNHSLVLDRCLCVTYAVQASQSLRPGDPANPLPVSPTASLALWLYGCKSLCPGFHSCSLGISQGGDTSSLSCPQAQTWPEETTLLTPSTPILLFLASKEAAGAILDRSLFGILECHWFLLRGS